jgi:hypothetical protein
MNGRLNARRRTGAGNMPGNAFSRRANARRFLSARHSDMVRSPRVGADHATAWLMGACVHRLTLRGGKKRLIVT